MIDELKNEGIKKEGKATFYKSKLNALESRIYLTPSRLVVMSVSGSKMKLGGIVGLIVELTKKKKYIIPQLNVALTDIESVTQGKAGLNKQILEIKKKDGETVKVGVNNFAEWAKEIQ